MNDKTNAVILKQSDYRESDALILAYTEKYGLLSFVARGLRKLTSRNAASLYPFSISEILFDYKEGRDIFALHTAHLIYSAKNIPQDLKKTAISSILSELSDIIGREERYDEEINRNMYQLISLCTREINEGEDDYLALSFYFAKVLDWMGIAPEADSCALCGNTKVSAISVEDGGFVCAECYPSLKEDVRILRQFRLVNKAEIKDYEVLKKYGPYEFALAEHLYAFLSSYLGINLKSWDFLKQILVIK